MEDAMTADTIVGSSATSLGRTAGRASLVKVPGGISLARTVLRATLAFPRRRHHQEGMKATIRTRGLGIPRASRHRLHPRRLLGPGLSPHLHYKKRHIRDILG